MNILSWHRIREQNSILGNFLCEQRLPGLIRGEYGKDFVLDLRRSPTPYFQR